jgi:hypothetical protein
MSRVDAGGTGNVGSKALKSPVAQYDLTVCAIVRNPAKAQWIADLCGELVPGNLDDAAAASVALRDVIECAKVPSAKLTHLNNIRYCCAARLPLREQGRPPGCLVATQHRQLQRVAEAPCR